jgi:tetratricopeptide (TPR) repeat protein
VSARLRRLLATRWGRLLPVLLLALPPVGFTAYLAAQYVSAEYHLRAARQADARSDFEGAQGHLAACLQVRPDNPEVHFQMARAARRAGHYGQAREHLSQCERLGGMTPATALEGAMLRAQQGNLAPVEDPLWQLVDRGSPRAPEILEALAHGYIYAYRLDAAMACLNRLLDREPDNVEALFWRGSLWQTAGNEPAAEADYRRVLALRPDRVDARLQLGESLLRRKQAAEALEQYESLRRRGAGDPAAVLLGVARCHRQLGDVDRAREALDELLAGHPQDVRALVERGKIVLEGEGPAAAEGWFRRGVAAYPLDHQANYLLAQCLRQQGKDDEAREFQAAVDRIDADLKGLEAAFGRVGKAPRDPAPRLEAGLICLRNGKEEEGLRWLFSALQLDPDHAPTRAALADYYEGTGRPDLAAPYRRPAPLAPR